MQRAGGAPSSSPSTPSEPPIKRQRLSNGSVKSTHSSTPHHGAQQMPNALAGEEQKRTQVVNHEPADRGESRWYLSFKEPQAPSVDSPLRIVSAGYSMLDAAKDRSSEEEEESQASRQVKGRRSFGKFNRTLEVRSTDTSRRSCLLVCTETTGFQCLVLRLRIVFRRRRRRSRGRQRRSHRSQTHDCTVSQRRWRESSSRTQSQKEGREGRICSYGG